MLAWGESSTDMSQLGKMLQQLCYANVDRSDSVVVVLTAVSCLPSYVFSPLGHDGVVLDGVVLESW